MAFELKNTNSVARDGVKILVYGQAGAGKTCLCATLDDVVILSAEAGLLSIAGSDLPYIQIDDMATLQEVYLWLRDSEDSKKFRSIALDSISEIAEKVLNAEKARSKDPRQAYGEMQDTVTDIIRLFRDLPGRDVYFSAKVEKSQDETGRVMYAPSMPGNKMGQSLPYFFDEVLALRVEKNADGLISRALQCDTDGLWQAKDRSGALDMWEEPHLGDIIKKIRGE